MKVMLTNPDDQVIGMVNAGVAQRKREADRRRMLRQMADLQYIEARKRRREEMRRMVVDAGSCVALAAAILFSAKQGLIAASLAWPLAVAVLATAAIIFDRWRRK